jgi:NAD(P)-dependent dehydrogenase (short-subunit alcohol dehydrogenase family)
MSAFTPSSGRILEGTTALVLGASAGIGRAAAIALGRLGAVLEIASNDEKGILAVGHELEGLGYEAYPGVVDVSSEARMSEYFTSLRGRRSRLGILVNSAGIQRFGTAETTPSAVWDEVMAVNLKSIFLSVGHAVPLLRANGGGSVVNVSSAQAHLTQRNVVAYTASKGAIVAMTRAMAVDHAVDKIRVNSVSPGSVDTPLLRNYAQEVSPSDPDAVIASWGALHPLGRVAEAEEIANVIAFLAGPLSSFVTGADFRVDGGITAGIGSAVAPGPSR